MKLIFIILLTINLYGASSELLDEYMSISSATEELAAMETQLSSVQRILKIDTPYDVALIEQRYKNKIGELLSDNELQEILDNYKYFLYARLVHEMTYEETDPQALTNMIRYYKDLVKNKEASVRLQSIKEISNNMMRDEFLENVFSKLLSPMLKFSGELDSDSIKKIKKRFIDDAKLQINELLSYRLQDLSIEDLKNLAKFTKKSSVYNEQKAGAEASIYAIDDYTKVLMKTLEEKFKKRAK